MRILFLEDDERIAKAVTKGFTLENWTVDAVTTGDEAFDLATTEPYDVLVLDVMVPGMSGVEVCVALRKENIKTPILLLTALGEIDQRVAGLESGADDYLPKPFAFEELVARIRALVRRPPLKHSNTLTLGSITLNTSELKASRYDSVIPLSQKEFALLECFLRHPDQVLSKDQLISHVWNFDADVLSNTVEVTIKNLRRKLESPFPNKKSAITTVRGFGYKIERDV